MFCSCIFYLHWMIKNLFLKHTYLHCYWWTSRISVQGWIEKHLYLRECFHIFSSKFWFVIEIGYALVNAPATMVCGQTTDCHRMRNQFDLWSGYKEESYFCTCCLLVFVGHPFRELPYVFPWAAAEQLHPGCSSLLGFNPAENLPSGLVLCHHWNRH